MMTPLGKILLACISPRLGACSRALFTWSNCPVQSSACRNGPAFLSSLVATGHMWLLKHLTGGSSGQGTGFHFVLWTKTWGMVASVYCTGQSSSKQLSGKRKQEALLISEPEVSTSTLWWERWGQSPGTLGNRPPCVLFREKRPPPVNSDMDKTFLNVVIFCIKNTCVENTVVCVTTFGMCLT